MKKNKPKIDIAFEQLKELAKKFPDDVFIQSKFKYYIPYTTEKGKTDDDYLYDALKEKYGL